MPRGQHSGSHRGRPKGVVETKPRNTVAKKVAAVAAEGGITPLEVMLTAMREDWDASRKMLADACPEDPAEAAKWTDRIMALRGCAIATADKVAPYLHARLSSIDTTVVSDNVHRVISDEPMTEENWTQEYGTPANDTTNDPEDDVATG